MSKTTTDPCPVCGGTFRPTRRDWVLACENCGLLASTLEPVIPQTAGDSPIDEAARAKGLHAARKQTNRLILDTLAREGVGSGGRVLDVGCGHGIFLRDAIERGLRAEGVEPDANVVDLARETTGASVHHGFFPEAVPEGESFDAIVFNDVLEHIPAAQEAVLGSAARLAPGGLLILNCPDRRGIFYRAADFLDRAGAHGPYLRMWQQGLPSPHVWYFRGEDLVRLGERAGLSHRRTVRTSPVSSKGLYERIAYVREHSFVMRAMTYLAAMAVVPFLGLLPKDNSIVVLQKPVV